MVAEQDTKRINADPHRSDRHQLPSRVERYSETDRPVRSNSLRERASGYRSIYEDKHTQSLTSDRDGNHGIIAETRRLSEPQNGLDSILPAEADPIDSYQNFQVPNQSKIYIGGLPEFTRLEDLNDCFSRLGRIKIVELKSGYGFVEYDNPQSARDAVVKYHEGTFLGSHIKVEISRGGSRPRHVAVSNNPEACYTCGVPGHWARDCPNADGQINHKRRLRARSRSPPRGRESSYVHRDPRNQLEVTSHEHHHLRRRSPLGQIDYIRDEHEGLAPSPRERYHIPVQAEGKRYRSDHSFRHRNRDYERAIDLKVLPQQDYRDSHMMAPSLSRTPPLIARNYHLAERDRNPGAHLSQSLPRGRDSQNDWTPEIKSGFSKSAYQRNLVRPHGPVRFGGYDSRSYDDRCMPYHDGRTGASLTDERYEIPDARFPRATSPRRLMRSPRRSLSPPRRPSNNYRSSHRAQSPPGSRIGHDSGPAGYTRTSYSMRR